MTDKITLWLPEQDRHRLAILGKLAEEASELAARATRCIIQGLDERDPKTGRLNSEELQREIADVDACVIMVERGLGIGAMAERSHEKLHGYAKWHALIDRAEAAE